MDAKESGKDLFRPPGPDQRGVGAASESRFDEVVREGTTTIVREVSALQRMVEEFSRFARLPEAQRRAVTMLKIEEKSLKEVSAATGMSIVALKVTTHRAVKNLRKLLDGKNEKT